MPNEVVLTGTAELGNIAKSIMDIQKRFEESMKASNKTGKTLNENLEKTTRNTQNSIKASGAIMRRLAGQLYSDFKSLLALNSVLGALKISSQFAGSIKESITLSDTIRRLGTSFGIAQDQFGKFQADLAGGLGEIGASSEAAAEALKGLTGLGVNGGASAINLVKGAVQLAGVGGEKGQEGKISGLIAGTVRAQGKNVNDKEAQNQIIGEANAAVRATGKSATEILDIMQTLFQSMDKSLRGKIGPQAIAQIAAVSATVGPDAAKAFEEYLSKSPIERKGMEAQGVNFFNKSGGLDLESIKKFITEGKQRIGFDPRKSLQTMGFSQEASEGLIRLADQSDQVADSLNKLSTASRDSEQSFRETMGLGDALKGTVNTIKGKFEQATEGVTKSLTDMVSAQVGDTGGSAAVVGGGAILAAVLAGGGIRGLFGTIVGEGQKKALETVTGEKVQDVFVTNWMQMSGGGSGIPGGGMVAKATGVLAAGAVGYEVGEKVVNPLLDKYTQGTNEDTGFQGNAVERFFDKLDTWTDGALSGTDQKYKIQIDTKDPNLRANDKPGRGSSN